MAPLWEGQRTSAKSQASWAVLPWMAQGTWESTLVTPSDFPPSWPQLNAFLIIVQIFVLRRQIMGPHGAKQGPCLAEPQAAPLGRTQGGATCLVPCFFLVRNELPRVQILGLWSKVIQPLTKLAPFQMLARRHNTCVTRGLLHVSQKVLSQGTRKAAKGLLSWEGICSVWLCFALAVGSRSSETNSGSGLPHRS